MRASEEGIAGLKTPFHWAWIILGTCLLDLVINYAVRLGFGVALPEMIRTLGFGRAAGGSIYNAYLFSYIALTPLTGYLTDRLGARPVITSCCFILGLGTLLMGTIATLWTACLFYAIVGLGATGMWTPVITVVQRWFSPNRRGLALGIVSTGPGVGLATMGAAFPWIVYHFSWRYVWYFLGTGALVMVLINGLLLRSDPEQSGYLPWGQMNESSNARKADFGTKTGSRSFSLLHKNRTFWLIGFSYLSMAYCFYGITTFMVDYAKYQMGLPLERASFLATVHGASQVVGVLTILPLSDYLGRKKTLIITNSCIAACLVGILFTGNSWGMLVVLVGIMAFFGGATFPVYGACAGDYFPRDMIGTVIGAWTPLYGMGAILVHWVTGILRDTTGIYNHAFMISAAMAVTSLFLMTLVKKRESSLRPLSPKVNS